MSTGGAAGEKDAKNDKKKKDKKDKDKDKDKKEGGCSVFWLNCKFWSSWYDCEY